MVLDAASLYFRAFYGVPSSVRAPDGTPVNAVRGFVDMMATLVSRFNPAQLAVCLDEDWRPAWRVALIASYKTHRVAGVGDGASISEPVAVEMAEGTPDDAPDDTPDDLAIQVPIILEVLDAFGIAAVGAADHEADDVLATLSATAITPVDVVSGDRDLFQLIDDDRQVRVLYTGRGVAKLEIMDSAALQRRYGIRPDQYVDFAVLRGDPSDGLPGVPGIGEKTAATLLTTVGGLDQLLQAVAKQDPRVRGHANKLNKARDYLAVAPRVVRTVTDLPLGDLDLTRPTVPADPGRVPELAGKWGLAAPLTRLVTALSRR